MANLSLRRYVLAAVSPLALIGTFHLFFTFSYTRKNKEHIIIKDAHKNIASDKQGIFARFSLNPPNEDSETIKKSPNANKNNWTRETTTYLLFFNKKELMSIKPIYMHSKSIKTKTESDEWKIAA
ncbi:MAG: hypothetical protein K2N58_07565 [Treponemataceae bacterium]|nr:hypothetical protein [Treponemataceae bacterium]